MSNARLTSAASLLVIDDRPSDLALLVSVLSAQGWRVLAATDGEAALGLATRRQVPDLVLLDAEMPGLDGYEVLRRLQDDPATAGTPVMMMTAAGDRAGEARALGLGAVECLAKPLHSPSLLLRVRRQLEAIARRRAVRAPLQQAA